MKHFQVTRAGHDYMGKVKFFPAAGIDKCTKYFAVRFHDESPEIVNLYLSSLDDDYEHWIQIREKNLEPEKTDIRTPGLSPRTQQQQHINHSSPQRAHDPIDLSPSNISLHSTSTSRTSSKPFQPFTEREAILVRNFVENMALWVCPSVRRKDWSAK